MQGLLLWFGEGDSATFRDISDRLKYCRAETWKREGEREEWVDLRCIQRKNAPPSTQFDMVDTLVHDADGQIYKIYTRLWVQYT